jgi:flagellar hook-associated protein 2
MASITSAGIGSGLDVEGIVTKLMALERIPLNNLKSKEKQLDSQISAFGFVKSSLAEFQKAVADLASADKFKVFAPTSSNESVATVTADSAAATGTFDVITTQLAQRNKFTGDAVADGTTVVGTGTLTLAVGADSFDVVIDSSNDELNQIRDAINNATDNKGVTASVLTDDAGSRLILTSDDTGTANALTISSTGDVATNLNLVEKDQALDSIATIDGFTVTNTTNKVTGAIQGVTMDILTLGSSTINVNRDDAQISSNVGKFVSAFNKLGKDIEAVREKGATLEADNTVLSVQNGINSVFNTSANITNGDFSFLAEVGLTRNELGEFVLDSSMLTTALDSDFEGVASLFSDDTEGFMSRLDDMVTGFNAFDGIVATRTEGLTTQVSDNRDQQDKFEVRLTIIEQRIRRQFSALDVLVGKLQSTSSFLTQQLANLPGPAKK